MEQFATSPPPTADSRLLQLHDYWRSVHPPGGGLPGRQHIDPVAMPALLPWIWLVDVERSPPRFKYRLIGTEHVRILGRDLTGHWLDDAFPSFRGSAVHDQFVAVVERAEVGYRRGDTVIILPKDYRSMERLLLPLARDGRQVDMLLAISIYHKAG